MANKMVFWFFLAVSFLVRATQIPNFKWSQTNDSISITAYYDPSKIVRLKAQATIQMENQDFTPVTKDYNIETEWLHVSWNNFRLDLHLRENVKPEESWCKWKEQFVVCKLRKEHDHVFDFLCTRDQYKEMKRYGTKDWEATTVGNNQDEFHFDDSISIMTQEEITTKHSKKKNMIVRAFYPWCSKCRDEQETFETLRRDKKIKKKKFVLGVVDAREDREGGRFMRAECGKCKFNVYYRGKKFIIDGKKKKKEFINEIMLEVEDPFVKIKSAQKLEKIAKKTPVVAGYFEDEQSNAYLRWIAGAKEMRRRDDIKYGLLQRDNPNWAKAITNGANRVVIMSGNQKHVPKESMETISQKNFTTFVEVYGASPFEKYSYELKKKWETVGLDLPIVKVFLDSDKPEKKLERKFKRLAEEYREKVIFLWFPDNQDHQMVHLGMQKTDKPGFGISTTLDQDTAKHYASFEDLNVANVRAHIDRFLEGSAVQTFKTQPDPYADKDPLEFHKPGDVIEVVHKTWDEQIDKSLLDTAVLMYKNWTTHKQEAFDVFNAVSILCKDIDIKFVKYDYHENYYHYERFGTKKHESKLILMYIRKNRGPIFKADENKDAWDIDYVVNFLAQHNRRGPEIRERAEEFKKFSAEKEEKERMEAEQQSETGDPAPPEPEAVPEEAQEDGVPKEEL